MRLVIRFKKYHFCAIDHLLPSRYLFTDNIHNPSIIIERYSMIRYSLTMLLPLLICALLYGCSKDETPTTPATTGSTYYGTFANSAESGSMTLSFASAPKASPTRAEA